MVSKLETNQEADARSELTTKAKTEAETETERKQENENEKKTNENDTKTEIVICVCIFVCRPCIYPAKAATAASCPSVLCLLAGIYRCACSSCLLFLFRPKQHLFVTGRPFLSPVAGFEF